MSSIHIHSFFLGNIYKQDQPPFNARSNPETDLMQHPLTNRRFKSTTFKRTKKRIHFDAVETHFMWKKRKKKRVVPVIESLSSLDLCFRGQSPFQPHWSLRDENKIYQTPKGKVYEAGAAAIGSATRVA